LIFEVGREGSGGVPSSDGRDEEDVVSSSSEKEREENEKGTREKRDVNSPR